MISWLQNREYFFAYLTLIVIAAAIVFRPKKRASHFGLREGDVRGPRKQKPDANEDQTRAPKNKPLSLEGFVVYPEAHRTLGVHPDAGESEILDAYRALMKRFHPDLVGPPGSRQWNDAQLIAAAINKAKEEMLKRSHKNRA